MAAPARRRVLLSLTGRSGTLNDIIGPSWPRLSSGPPLHWLKRQAVPAPSVVPFSGGGKRHPGSGPGDPGLKGAAAGFSPVRRHPSGFQPVGAKLLSNVSSKEKDEAGRERLGVCVGGGGERNSGSALKK